MFRLFLTCMLACASALAQTAPASPQTSSTPPVASVPRQVFHPENVGPNTVVVEIQGICSPLSDGTVTQSPCVTQITKSQFNAMVAAVHTPMPTTAAQRNYAEGYIQLLALADAAEKAGMEKDPQFIELMKIVRIRTLAEAYRYVLEDKANNPSQADVEAFYKQNSAKYEQIRAERVIIPRVSRAHPVAATPAEAAKKVTDLANQIRERAIKGEDMTILQADVYKALALPAPPNTDLGSRRRGTLPPAIEAQLFSMKPGEVTKVLEEPSGFTIYRLRTHDVPSLDSIRTEALRDMHQQYVATTTKATTDRVHTNLNLDFFTPFAAFKGPVPTHPAHLEPPVQAPVAAGTKAPEASPSPVAPPKQ